MGFVSTNKTDGDVNLAIFRIKGTTLNDHWIKNLGNSYHPHSLCSFPLL
jgi:hypothetical protein